MYAKVLGVVLLVSGAFALPPLQVEPYAGLRPDRMIELRKREVSTQARLPLNVIPIHYKVNVTPIIDPLDSEFLKAPGHVQLIVQCDTATSIIVLNAAEMDIVTVTVADADGVNIPVSALSQPDPTAQTFNFTVVPALVQGSRYTIEIDFVATVADGRDSTQRKNGLYLSTIMEAGVENYHLATQFEDIAARLAFPCFDEPAFRATFAFSLGRKEVGYHTLWNMEKINTVPLDGRTGYVWDVYPQVPVTMPTYLLAIVVSDFVNSTAPVALYPKGPVRTWGPKGLMESSDGGVFASATAAKILAFYDVYLDYTYDFPKMDSVAIPIFQAGAMENWGLNLYQTYLLLFTEGDSTQAEKWSIASVLAHELAHQWWGNLVTMEWWNDLWLNEGFATYMSFHGANASAPEFEPMNRVATDNTQSAQNFDAGETSTAINSGNTEGLSSTSSRIIYDKGASVIRMMNAFLTESTLLTGLRNYLKDKAYDNAVQDELFQHLTTQAHADETLSADFTVKQIMDTWTLQPGFPLIRVTRAGANRIYLSQERFVNDPAWTPAQTGWYVPIAYVTKSEPDVNIGSLAPKLWINDDVLLASHTVGTEEWILLNPDSQSYYRVLYDDHFTTLLQIQLGLQHTEIPALSRSQLIDDYFKSAYAQYVSIREAMEFTLYLGAEEELSVWTSAFNNLRPALTIVSDSVYEEDFRVHFEERVGQALTRIKPEPSVDESPVTTLLRTQLLDWACAFGHELCVSTAAKLINEWILTPGVNPIWADFQPMLYCTAVARRGDDVWNFVLGKYQDVASSTRQRGLLLNALACTIDPSKITSLINMAADATDSDILPEHAIQVLERLAMNKDGGQRNVFDYILKNAPAIHGNTRLGPNAISRVIASLSNYLSTTEDLSLVEKLLNDNEALFDAELETSLKASIAKIQSNIKWLAVHGPGLAEFFAAQQST